jgi:hypothetical protein
LSLPSKLPPLQIVFLGKLSAKMEPPHCLNFHARLVGQHTKQQRENANGGEVTALDAGMRAALRSVFMSIWWCNQSNFWARERPANIVCSSEEENTTFRKTVGEAKKGDLVVHYKKQGSRIMAFSRAREDGRYYNQLPLLADGYDYGSGWRFATEYFDLQSPLNIGPLRQQLAQHTRLYYAIASSGKVKQAYFMEFDEGGLQILLAHIDPPLPGWLHG